MGAMGQLPAAHHLRVPGPGPSQTRHSGPVEAPTHSRANVSFPARDGTKLDAWLYLPKHTSGSGSAKQQPLPPLVILAHGMGAQKDMGLDQYAAAFAAAGLAALVFDYRTFGGSEGGPRQWASPSRHVEDWLSAVAYANAHLSAVADTSRLCLWGTSFAGGHVLAVAAQTPNVAAVVSQVPHLDARAATLASIRRRGVARSLAVVALGALDLARTRVGLPPVYLPLVGPPRSLAFMQLDDFETSEYYSKHPSSGEYQGGWANAARAALAFELFTRRYSPIKLVPSVAAPVLFVAAERDCLCPVAQVRRAVALAPRGELLSRDCTHFELYRGRLFEGLVAEQAAWLRRQTGLDGGGGGGKEQQQLKGRAEADAAAARRDQTTPRRGGDKAAAQD